MCMWAIQKWRCWTTVPSNAVFFFLLSKDAEKMLDLLGAPCLHVAGTAGEQGVESLWTAVPWGGAWRRIVSTVEQRALSETMDCGLGLCKSTGGDIKGQHETHKTTKFWDSVLEDYTSARNRFGILTWRKTFQFHKQLLRVLSMLLHAFPSCGLPPMFWNHRTSMRGTFRSPLFAKFCLILLVVL